MLHIVCNTSYIVYCMLYHTKVDSPNPPTDIVGFRGLDSSIILILRGGIRISRKCESGNVSRDYLVGRLGVFCPDLSFSGFSMLSCSPILTLASSLSYSSSLLFYLSRDIGRLPTGGQRPEPIYIYIYIWAPAVGLR